MAIIIVSCFRINQSVKTKIIGKKTQHKGVQRGKQNIIYTTLTTLLGYDGPKVQKYFSLISRANMACISFRDVVGSTLTTVKTSENWRFPNHSSSQFNKQQGTNSLCAVCIKKGPDSYLIHVCFITIVLSCSTLHIHIYFEL